MLSVGGTQAVVSRAGLPPLRSRVLLLVPPDASSMITLTICLVAAALVGFALLLFRRRD